MNQTKQLTRVEIKSGTAIVHFETERINDYALARRLGDELHGLLARQDCRQIILNFDGLDYVVSEVFSVLLRLANDAGRNGCRLKACHLSSFFREIYETMRFQQVIPMFETLEEAMAA